jgi:flagellar biosynthesis/type III secretory pathway M-ring protein FliF/YscJ
VIQLEIGSHDVDFRVSMTTTAAASSTYIAVVVVIFVVIFIAILVICFCCFQKRKKKRRIGQAGEVLEMGEDEEVHEYVEEGPQQDTRTLTQSDKDRWIPRVDIPHLKNTNTLFDET